MSDTMRTLLIVSIVVIVIAVLLVGWIYLRRRNQNAAARSPDNASPATAVTVTDAAAEAETPAAIPVEFRLATAEDEPPVLTATLLDPEAFTQACSDAKPLNTRSGGVSRLAPILQAARLTAEVAEQRSIRYMKVVVNDALARCADGQSFRAFVLDSDGRIIEHARLKDASRLKFTFGGALLFQAVTVIVAQKHLKDINAQLTQIRHGIDEIRDFLDRERRHEVLSIVDALQQRIPEIQAGFLDDRWLQQLGANDQSLARIQGHLREEIQSATAALSEITTGFWDAAKTRQEHIQSLTQRFARACTEWQITTQARILGWNLLVAFPCSAELKVERRRSIEREMDLLFADQGLIASFDLSLREQVAKIQALLWKADANRRRELLFKQQDERRSELRLHHEALVQSIAAVLSIEQNEDGVMQLAVKLDGDDVIEAYELASTIDTQVVAVGPLLLAVDGAEEAVLEHAWDAETEPFDPAPVPASEPDGEPEPVLQAELEPALEPVPEPSLEPVLELDLQPAAEPDLDLPVVEPAVSAENTEPGDTPQSVTADSTTPAKGAG